MKCELPKPSESVWMETVHLQSFSCLTEDLQCDVCIVGGGIAGLTTAYMLAKKKYSVVLLDDGPIASGETQRTTAHLSNALDDRYFEIEKIHGAENTKILQESHTEAINQIEKIISDEKIDCDFKRLSGYLMAGSDHDHDFLEKEREAAERAGIKGLELLDSLPFKNKTSSPCLRFPEQGRFHVLKYMQGLLKALERLGVKVFCYSHVNKIEGELLLQVTVANKHKVTASSVIVATNSPISDLLKIHTKQAAYRTYAIGALINKRIPDALYWDTHDPYHYVRFQKLESGETLIIVGGEDHKTGQADDAEERYRNLEQWAKDWFPGVGEVKFRWSGQVCEPVDGVAFIGKDPAFKEGNVYIATGDSGMGMTHGTIAGILITALIKKKSHPWQEIYSPDRKTLQSLPEYIKENINSVSQYVAAVEPSKISATEDICPEQAAIIDKHGSKTAAYCDKAGEVHQRSAYCTHLKGVVRWNSGENSWDCPVHGSRFSVDGCVINGPAVHALEEAVEERDKQKKEKDKEKQKDKEKAKVKAKGTA